MASLYNRFSAFAYEAIFRSMAGWRPPVHAKPLKLSARSRILVFSCAGIGDTLTDSVVFKALSESFPGAYIAGVGHRRRRILLEHNPYIDQIFLFHKGPTAFWRLQRELREAGPWDAILHLRGNDPEPRCLTYLVDPNITVSVPNMTRLGWLCGHHVEQPDWDQTHGVEQTMRIARYVGADTRKPHLVYEVTDEERDRLEEKFLVMGGIGTQPRLVLQLGGGRRASWRDWPISRYAALLRLASQALDAEIFVLGGPDQEEREQELARLLAGEPKRYHNVVGKLSLAESAALLASARVLVSTDTGIMHLGFAVGTRVIALIHCNNPAARVGPYGYGDRHRVVQLARPANYRSPADADMANITEEEVFRQLLDIWHA